MRMSLVETSSIISGAYVVDYDGWTGVSLSPLLYTGLSGKTLPMLFKKAVDDVYAHLCANATHDHECAIDEKVVYAVVGKML